MTIITGKSTNDFLAGESSNDFLFGESGDDTLYGQSGDDFLFGGSGNDRLNGGYGNDALIGQSGDDVLVGTYGNDVLVGGAGNDTLTGFGRIDASGPLSLGTNEIDTLVGGTETDNFYLWGGSGRSGIRVAYDDSNSTTTGVSDYALIVDFNSTEDVITLTSGVGLTTLTPVNYTLGASPSGLPTGTGIFVDKPDSQPDELIAILEGVSPDSMSLNDPYFNYAFVA